MSRNRRSLSGPYRDLKSEISKLSRIDDENQRKFSPGPGRPSLGMLSLYQIHLLTESVFSQAFRSFESFVRDIFLLYCLEVRPKSGKRVVSYIQPQSFTHAEKMIKSSMPFLDWSSPDVIIERSEMYLKNGFPVKDVFTSRRQVFRHMKSLRNHIAHDSIESNSRYLKVLRNYYGTTPVKIPRPGKFLLEPDRNNSSQYLLKYYLNFLIETADDLI